MLVVAAGAAWYGVDTARRDTGAPQPAGWTPPSTADGPANEAVTCYVLVPLLSAATTEATEILKNPSRSTAVADATAGQLRVLERTAPAAWRSDIATQYRTLEQLAAAHGDLGRIAAVDSDAYYDATIRLTGGCKQYAAS